MGTFFQNFEGFAANATLVTGDAGGQSPLALVTGGTLVATTTDPLGGSKSGSLSLSTGTTYVRFDNVGATGRCGALIQFRYPGPPSGGSGTLIGIRNNDGTDTGICGFQLTSAGLPQMTRGNSGTVITESRPSSGILTPGQKAFVSIFYAPGATAANGRMGYRVYGPDGTTILHEWAPATDYDVGVVGSGTRYRLGQLTTSTWADSKFVFDTVIGGDLAEGWFTPPLAGPAISVDSDGPLWMHDARATTGGTGLTFTVEHTSGPNNLTTMRQPVPGLFFFDQDTSSSTYTLTATSSNGTSTHVMTVPAVATATAPGVVRWRMWNGTALV